MRIRWTSIHTGILAGVVIGGIFLGSLGALYQNKSRLYGIAKAQYKNFIKHKRPDDKDIGKEIYGNLNEEGKDIIVFVNAKRKGPEISPLLYGSNLSPKMESEPDIIKFVQDKKITVFRFPGGGSPGYHWKEGKFDFGERFAQTPFSQMDYVVGFCKLTGSQLVIQVNVESGTALEAAEWVTYMKDELKFPVMYWELGNEVYGDWDRAFMSGKDYGKLIREYAALMKAADPTIKIGMDWAPATRWFFNIDTIKGAGDLIDFVSVHWYPNDIDPAHPQGGRIHPELEEVMANFLHIPGIVKEIRKTFRRYAPGRQKQVEVAFLEWDGATDGPASDFAPYSRGIVQWSLANAIFHADCLGMFATTGVSAATQFDFQSIGFGLIRGWDQGAGWGGQRWDGEIIRPKALAIELFSKYFGDVLLPCRIQNAPFYVKKKEWAPETFGGRVPYVTVYASTSEKEKTLSLAFINKHPDRAFAVKVFILEGQPANTGKLYVLTGPSLLSQNEQNPMTVGIKEYRIRGLAKEFDYTLPPHSVSMVVTRLEGQ
ncbi:MAG: hypothetical protein WC732_00370 [Candidatus Omnitrophota bacterium]